MDLHYAKVCEVLQIINRLKYTAPKGWINIYSLNVIKSVEGQALKYHLIAYKSSQVLYAHYLLEYISILKS